MKTQATHTADSQPVCYSSNVNHVADARLIAAAPELLEALTLILDSMKFDEKLYGHDPKRCTFDFPKGIRIAERAIARATGGAV